MKDIIKKYFLNIIIVICFIMCILNCSAIVCDVLVTSGIPLLLNVVFGAIGISAFISSMRYQKKNEKSNDIFRREAYFNSVLLSETVSPCLRIRRYRNKIEGMMLSFPTNDIIEIDEELKKYLNFIFNIVEFKDYEYIKSFKISGKPQIQKWVIVTSNLLSDYFYYCQEQNLNWRQAGFGFWFSHKYNIISDKNFITKEKTYSTKGSSYKIEIKDAKCSITGNKSEDFYFGDFRKCLDQIYWDLNNPNKSVFLQK